MWPIPAPPGGWWNFLLPDDSGQLWGALGAVATALALYYAARSARQATLALRFEHRPVVYLENQGGRIVLRNAGRGVALNAHVTNEEGEVRESVAAIAPGEAIPVRANAVNASISAGNRIYCQNAEGTWFLTRAVGQGFGGGNAPFSNAFVGRVWGWRLPSDVKRSQRRSGRSAWEHYQQLSSYVSFEGWRHRLTSNYTSARIGLIRWWHGIGEEKRLALHRHQIAVDRPAFPDILPRSQWDVDVSGFIDCWKGARLVRQLSCEWIDDVLVAQVDIGGASDAAGILRIPRVAFDRLPPDREKRNIELRKLFRRYIAAVVHTVRSSSRSGLAGWVLD